MRDQELDKLIRKIARDAAIDDARADEIADSPTLWWNVQREIRNAEPAKAPWPPNFLRRWLMIGVPVAALLVIGIGVWLSSTRSLSNETAELPAAPPATSTQPAETLSASANAMLQTKSSPAVVAADAKTSTTRTMHSVRAVVRSKNVAPRTLTAKRTNAAIEIKSEFIALAYARDPESGQLLRVKVPSSMMVTLGLVSTVEKPNALVDAEVIVGDDGLTRAIRFIRQ